MLSDTAVELDMRPGDKGGRKDSLYLAGETTVAELGPGWGKCGGLMVWSIWGGWRMIKNKRMEERNNLEMKDLDIGILFMQSGFWNMGYIHGSYDVL
jgi:hypothetical protein